MWDGRGVWEGRGQLGLVLWRLMMHTTSYAYTADSCTMYCCTLYRWPFMVPRSETIRIASCAICWWMSKGTSPAAPAPPAALAAPGAPA